MVFANNLTDFKSGGKHMTKKVLSLLLTVVMTLGVLSGCGSSAQQNSAGNQEKEKQSDSQSKGTADTQDQENAQSGSNDESIELSVVLITGEDAFEEGLNRYSADHPNIILDIQKIPTEEFKTIVKAKFASNDAPDILPVFSGEENEEYYKNGYLKDLSVMKDDVARIEKGADSTLRTTDGALYGFPIEKQLILGFYNKELFEENQLEAPKSWEELLKICEIFKDKGITPIAMGHKDTWTTQMITYGLNATSVQVADPEFYKKTASGEAKFADSKGFLDTLTKYKELLDKDYIQEGSLSTTAEQAVELFINKKAAITFSGSWGTETINSMGPDFAVGGFEIPNNEGMAFGASISINGGFGLSAKSEHPEEAQALLSYMISEPVMKDYLKGKGPSPYTDVSAEIDPALMEAIEQEKGQQMCQFDNIYWAPGVQEVFLRKYRR